MIHKNLSGWSFLNPGGANHISVIKTSCEMQISDPEEDEITTQQWISRFSFY